MTVYEGSVDDGSESDNSPFEELTRLGERQTGEYVSASPFRYDYEKTRLALEQEDARKQEAQEAKRVRDELDLFVKGPVKNTWGCPKCGDVVFDRHAHIRHHDRLAQTTSDADQARIWHTPLG